MLNSANTVQASVNAVTSWPVPNLRDTTSSRPPRPSASPAHWRPVTLFADGPSPEAIHDTHSAVSTGWSPTTSAVRPEPMPAFTAIQTPPR